MTICATSTALYTTRPLRTLDIEENLEKKTKCLKQEVLFFHYHYFAHYAFSEKDEEAMRSMIMKYDGVTPILEEDHGFSLVLHQRDFLPGRTILANIQNAVSTTRRMIMLLSRSDHCKPPSKLNFNSILTNRKKFNKKL